MANVYQSDSGGGSKGMKPMSPKVTPYKVPIKKAPAKSKMGTFVDPFKAAGNALDKAVKKKK